MEKESRSEFTQKLEGFIKTVKKAGTKAANKTIELADIASLNIKLQKLNVKLSEKFEELGRLSYKKLSGVGDTSADENQAEAAANEETSTETAAEAPTDETVDKIAALVDGINKLQEEIRLVKIEIKAKKK